MSRRHQAMLDPPLPQRRRSGLWYPIHYDTDVSSLPISFLSVPVVFIPAEYIIQRAGKRVVWNGGRVCPVSLAGLGALYRPIWPNARTTYNILLYRAHHDKMQGLKFKRSV